MPDPQSPLYNLRCQIDALDNQLLELLAQRYKILAEVVKVKEANGISHYVQSRVDEVLDKNAEKGKELGLPENYVRDLWQRMIDEAHVFEGEALGQTEEDRDYG